MSAFCVEKAIEWIKAQVFRGSPLRSFGKKPSEVLAEARRLQKEADDIGAQARRYRELLRKCRRLDRIAHIDLKLIEGRAALQAHVMKWEIRHLDALHRNRGRRGIDNIASGTIQLIVEYLREIGWQKPPERLKQGELKKLVADAKTVLKSRDPSYAGEVNYDRVRSAMGRLSSPK